MKMPFTLLLCAGLAVSCSGDMPTSSDGLTSNLGVAGNSGCYNVRGTINETGIPPIFEGTISGDLVGTTEANVEATFSTGPVNHNALAFSYHITGGIVLELMNEYLQLTTSKLTAIFAQDNPDVARINGSLKVESPGSGRLTLNGSADFTGLPLVVLSLEYRGVVCP